MVCNLIARPKTTSATGWSVPQLRFLQNKNSVTHHSVQKHRTKENTSSFTCRCLATRLWSSTLVFETDFKSSSNFLLRLRSETTYTVSTVNSSNGTYTKWYLLTFTQCRWYLCMPCTVISRLGQIATYGTCSLDTHLAATALKNLSLTTFKSRLKSHPFELAVPVRFGYDDCNDMTSYMLPLPLKLWPHGGSEMCNCVYYYYSALRWCA